MNKDIVAQLPDELAVVEKEKGQLPDNVKIEPGYACLWNDRYFIHTRATLPLKDIDGGIGFGLWVEVSKETFSQYMTTGDNEPAYKDFKTNGTLANNWPGFENTLGIEVTVRTIRTNEKVYITEVHIDKPRDPLFEVALSMQHDDIQMKEKVSNLISSYLEGLENYKDQ
jgi:hypothetical protein